MKSAGAPDRRRDMKTSMLIATALALSGGLFLAGTDAIACGKGKLILEDKFETLNPAWGFDANEPTRSNGPDGLVYKLPPSDDVMSYNNQSDLYDNYEVCAVFNSNVPEKSNGMVGVVFWANDYNNKYRFEILPFNGTYELERKKNNKWIMPISATPSDAIQKGTNVTNEISVTVKDNKATFAVNGKNVTGFTGAPPEGGSMFGFVMATDAKDSGPSTLNLKSIQLREVDGQPAASTSSIRQTLEPEVDGEYSSHD
jgi:hypothetical protein